MSSIHYWQYPGLIGLVFDLIYSTFLTWIQSACFLQAINIFLSQTVVTLILFKFTLCIFQSPIQKIEWCVLAFYKFSSLTNERLFVVLEMSFVKASKQYILPIPDLFFIHTLSLSTFYCSKIQGNWKYNAAHISFPLYMHICHIHQFLIRQTFVFFIFRSKFRDGDYTLVFISHRLCIFLLSI